MFAKKHVKEVVFQMIALKISTHCRMIVSKTTIYLQPSVWNKVNFQINDEIRANATIVFKCAGNNVEILPFF